MMESTTQSKKTHWHALKVGEVASRLGTDLEHGLSREEAESRLEQYGLNVVSKGKRTSALQVFLSQFTDPLVLVLIAAAAVTFLLREYVDTGVIIAVVLINATIGFVQEQRAESAIEALSKLLVVETRVLRSGQVLTTASENLVPGDVVILQSGDKVPADIRLVEAKNLHADESILTGESVPVSKATRPVDPGDPVSDRTCMAFSGTLATSGSAKGIVAETGDSTQIGLISSLISTTVEVATPLTRKLAKFGKWLSVVVVGASLVVLGLGVLLGQPFVEMFTAAVAIAVAMIPEGLPAIVTIVLAVGVRRMASRNAIIRNLPSVETLGSVTVICSDKTGTLTANEMTVRKIYAGGKEFEFEGVGYDPHECCVSPVDTDDTELDSEAFLESLRCGLLCNDSDLQEKDGEWVPDGDPTEVALIVSAMKTGFDPEDEREAYPRLDVVPFESGNMYMATMHANPDGGRTVYVKGSLERLLDMCANQLLHEGQGELDRQRIGDRAEDLARQGFRLLAFARKRLPGDVDEIRDEHLTGLTYLGMQAMSDPARPEAREAIRECREAGIEVKMITGDHVTTAQAIARDLHMGDGEIRAITGAELERISDEEFDRVVAETKVFARVAPEQKYRLVEGLQTKGHIVAMTGDGVNDAPALKKADIGVAMGRAGSDVAKDASDMVLTDDNFASIVAAVEEGRTVFSNLRKTLTYILPTNAGEGLVIIAALLGGFTLPVTPVQILWINTVTAVTLALPLAFEPQEPGLMTDPPRAPNAPILSRPLLWRIALVAAVMVIGAFAIFIYEESNGATIEQARTAAVGTIVAYELFYLFSARSERTPVWRMPLFANPYVWIGVFLVIILQLAFTYLPIMNLFFGTASIDWGVWVRIILVSFPIMLIVGVEKAMRLRLGRAHS